MLSTVELKCKVLDLESEMEQGRAAKAESDNQVSKPRKEVDSLSAELRELHLEVELRVSKGRETLRLEMKKTTQHRELNTHEELTIADKDAIIVDLCARFEREKTSGSGHPRVEDSDMSWHAEAGKWSDCWHYRRSRGVARMTMEFANGGLLK